MKYTSLAVMALLGEVTAESILQKKVRTFQEVTVDDYGFIVLGEETAIRKESDSLCDGDEVDDKEIEKEDDPHDPIVEDSGFVHKWVQTDAQINRYSDELANGDSADDRDIHEDEDMNDDVVDFNGHTNAGYGSKTPMDFFNGNHIASGHFITEPRAVQLSDETFLQLDESHDMPKGHWWGNIQSLAQRKNIL